MQNPTNEITQCLITLVVYEGDTTKVIKRTPAKLVEIDSDYLRAGLLSVCYDQADKALDIIQRLRMGQGYTTRNKASYYGDNKSRELVITPIFPADEANQPCHGDTVGGAA